MSESNKVELLRAFQVLLGPLVRILLRNGISYGEFTEVIRLAFVETALKDFKVTGRKATQTRVAVITGLTRKEVKRVIDEAMKDQYEPNAKSNRVERVLVGWHTDTEFIGPYGFPLELRYESQDKREPTFSELVKRHSGDMSPRSILDELVRVGAAIETDVGWFRVLRRDYIADVTGKKSFERTGLVVRNFVNTVDFNMTKPAPGKGRFERHVFPADGMRFEDFEKFDAYLRDKCQVLLEDLENWLTKLPDPVKSDRVIHTGVGMYHYMSHAADSRVLKQVLSDEGMKRESDFESESGHSREIG